MKEETKKLINDLNGCFTNDGNARFIHYKGAEKLLNQFKKDVGKDIAIKFHFWYGQYNGNVRRLDKAFDLFSKETIK